MSVFGTGRGFENYSYKQLPLDESTEELDISEAIELVSVVDAASETDSSSIAITVDDSDLPSSPEADTKILTKGYCASGIVVLGTSASQAIVNRIIGNNDLTSGEKDASFTLIMDGTFAHFENKMVKGNWTDVDSIAKQVLVLAGYVGAAVVFDLGAYYLIPIEKGQAIFFGKTSTISLVNALTYFSAMGIAGILGKKTYTVGPQLPKTASTHSLLCKAGASGLLVAVTAAAASLTNRLLINSSSSLGVVLNLACNEVVNKLFKTGQNAAKETSNKVKLLAYYWVIAATTDIGMGILVSGGLPMNDVQRFIGATAVGATMSFIKVSSKALLDDKKEKGTSRCRDAITLLTAVATPALAIASNHIPVIKGSPAFSFSVKLVQHNVNALVVRELFKKASGPLKRLAVSLVPAALAFGAEYIANTIDPEQNSFSFPVTGVAVVTGASYLGMTLSALLLKGDGDVDDG